MSKIISLDERRAAQKILDNILSSQQIRPYYPELFLVRDYTAHDGYTDFVQKTLPDVPAIPRGTTCVTDWLFENLLAHRRSITLSIRPYKIDSVKHLMTAAFAKQYKIRQIVLLDEYPSLPSTTVDRVVEVHRLVTNEATEVWYQNRLAASLDRTEPNSSFTLTNILRDMRERAY